MGLCHQAHQAASLANLSLTADEEEGIADFSLTSSEEELGSADFSQFSSPRAALQQSSLSEVAARLAASLSGVLDSVSETLSVTAAEEDVQASAPAASQAFSAIGAAAAEMSSHMHDQGRPPSAQHPHDRAESSFDSISADNTHAASLPTDMSRSTRQTLQPPHKAAVSADLSAGLKASDTSTDITAQASMMVPSSEAVRQRASYAGTDTAVPVSVGSLASERLGQRAVAAMALPAAAPSTSSMGITAKPELTELSSNPSSERVLAATFPIPHATAAVAKPAAAMAGATGVAQPTVAMSTGQGQSWDAQPIMHLRTAAGMSSLLHCCILACAVLLGLCSTSCYTFERSHLAFVSACCWLQAMTVVCS